MCELRFEGGLSCALGLPFYKRQDLVRGSGSRDGARTVFGRPDRQRRGTEKMKWQFRRRGKQE